MKKYSILLFLLSCLMTGIMISCIKSTAGNIEYIPVQKSDGGAWVFIDSKGERVGDQEWEFEPTVTIDGVFTARSDSGLTVYRWDGKEARPIDSLRNLVSVGVYNEGLLPVTPSMKRIRVVDGKGNIKFTLEPIDGHEISSCSGMVKDGMLIVRTVDGKTGVVNDKGEVVVKPQFDDISDFSDGFALAMNYSDDYESGPLYYVIDKEGKVIDVKGKFGYEEGECSYVPSFNHGIVTVVGQYNESLDRTDMFEINTEGQVTKVKDTSTWTDYLENGGKIVQTYNEDVRTYNWVDPKGESIMKMETSDYTQSLSGYGKFVVKQNDKTLTIYNLDGKELKSLSGNFYLNWPGGNFGLVIYRYNENYEPSEYMLLDNDGKTLETLKFYGVGTNKEIENTLTEEEMSCGGYYVTSAYVDVPAAATKLVSMITGNVKGKDYYYLGESVKDALKDENPGYLYGRKFSLPTDSGSYYLATGAGFYITGEATASADLVAPTYENYFEVHHYDNYGRAWGWNRKRQIGTHLNSSAKIVSFDIKLRTNHPSGIILRDAVAKRLKKDGYTLVENTDNYDEFTNGYQTAIIYGSNESDGVGVIISESKDIKFTPSEKAAFAANI